MKDNKLPKTSGPWMIGSISCGVTDHGRTVHLLSGDVGRVIIAKIWYPADASTPAATNRERLWHDLHNDPTVPAMMKLLLRRTKKIATNTLIQPQFTAQISRPRILIYNHGMISFTAENTFLMEDLASHGYIVISLQHAAQMEELKALQRALPPEQRKQQGRLQQRIQRAVGEERAALSKEYYQSAVNTNRIVAARARDVKYVIDTAREVLGAIPGDIGDAQIDSIGMIGYSVGGAVATEFAKTDGRAGSVVNVDGGIYGMCRDQPVTTPYLMVYSGANDGCNTSSLVCRDPETLSRKTINDTKHMNFHEIAMIYPSLRWLGVIGRANPFDVIILRNQYVIEFITSNLSRSG